MCDANMKKRKIKVAMVANNFEITGIATVMMSYGKALDKNSYDLTIIEDQLLNNIKRNAMYVGLN